jgi:hypothetical protein
MGKLGEIMGKIWEIMLIMGNYPSDDSIMRNISVSNGKLCKITPSDSFSTKLFGTILKMDVT